MTRLIAFIATLLLGAAAGAHVPRASVTASHGLDAIEQIVGIEHTGIESAAAELHFLETACTAKTARPARARLDASESACASVLTHCGVLEKWSSAEKWASAKRVDSYPNEQPTAGLPVFVLNLRFPGQQYDRETGTHYNYFRDYEPGTGRYVQSDPIGLRGEINTFAYVSSDPLSFSDLTGLKRGGVYLLLDPKDNSVQRSGRTNDLDRREGEHKNNPDLCDLNFTVLVETDDYSEQRGVEQLAHVAYNPPRDKIKPISDRNPRKQRYMNSGCQCLARNNIKLPSAP